MGKASGRGKRVTEVWEGKGRSVGEEERVRENTTGVDEEVKREAGKCRCVVCVCLPRWS